jgi:hypothetical protein
MKAVSLAYPEHGRVSTRVAARVAFVMPRADWVESNATLISRLAADEDVAVRLVGPDPCPRPAGLPADAVTSYPFFAGKKSASGFRLLREEYSDARQRRHRIDRFFSEFEPDCLVVISTTSRELLPWVQLARKRGIRILLMQSVFLAPNLRAHVRGENLRLVRRRGLGGVGRLMIRHLVQTCAGLPSTILKSTRPAAGADRIFVINASQQKIYAGLIATDRIEAIGAPLLDHLHARVAEVAGADGERAFRARWQIPPEAPLAVYVSKSLEQFCQDDPGHEREFQTFATRAFLDRFPKAVLLIKLHPIEDERAFTEVRDHPRIRLIKHADIHEIVHHARLVISLGTSTPAFYAVFHRRPRLILREADGIALDYQKPLIDVSVAVRTRAELEASFDELRQAGWPARLPVRFELCDSAAARFGADFEGPSTPRVHARLRAFLGLSPA